MTKSPRWGSVLAAAATAAVLTAAPLAVAGAAYATDNPYPPHATDHPYPPKPHEPHEPEHPYPPKPHEPGNGGPHGDHGHKPGSPHLADTGGDNTKELVLGGVAAALITAGAGTVLVVRRRHSS